MATPRGARADRFGYARAVARLRRVLELLGDPPESAAALRLVIQVHDDLLRFGRMGGITHEEGERLFAHARTLAERSGDRALLTRLLATFGESLFFAGGGADALGYLREANALAPTSTTRPCG